MKVIIAGSRSLPRGSATFAQPLLDVLSADDTVLLRSPMTDDPGTFEKVIAAYCMYLGVPYKWMKPQPTEEFPGRASVFVRDMDMVEAADSALLFFTRDDAEDGYSGTMHLLEKALDADIKVDAFVITLSLTDGMFHAERFGSSG